MVKIAALLVAASPVAALAASTSAKYTPLQKVTQLIQGLKDEIVSDGKKEAATYDEFACFCKSKTGGLGGSITHGKTSIETKSAEMAAMTQKRVDLAQEAIDTKKKKERQSTELDAETARCEKEAAEHVGAKADINKAISSLKKAISSLQTSKPQRAPVASLLAAKQAIQQNLELAQAMKIMDEGMPQGLAFIQEGASIDPNDPFYKFQSQDLIDMMEGMLKDFSKRAGSLDAEIAKAKAACSSMKISLSNGISDATERISTLESNGEKLSADIGSTRGQLVVASKQIQDDQLFLKDLTNMCQARATDWDSRAQTRADELGALDKALGLLTTEVAGADSVNKRALLQSNSSAVGASFLQQRSVSRVELQRGRSRAVAANANAAMQATVAGDDEDEQAGRARALAALQEASSRLGSTALASLALRMTADPFEKVKDLMQKLIERLIAEGTEEATKKGFCDMQLGKAEKDREFRSNECDKLDAELSKLEVKEEELGLNIAELTRKVKSLVADLKQATGIRAAERKENAATVATAKEGFEAVAQAMVILKTFYEDAASQASLLQVGASVAKGPGAGFEGGYEGKQTAANGIMAILEVIKSDFQRTVATTAADEKEAAAKFTEFDRASKADLSGMQTTIQLDTDELKVTTATIKVKYADLKDNQNAIDSALKRLEDLKPMCIDTGMSYEERVAKGKQEAEALKRALCLLDTNSVEEGCGQQRRQ